MRLVFNARGALREAARQCEADVFLDWFGNTADDLAVEYGPYEDASVFLAVVDDDGEVHGAGRMIQPGPAGLKTLNDLRRDPWRVDPDEVARAAGVDLAVTWEPATFAVKDGVRRRGYAAMEALAYGVVVGSIANHFTTLVAMIDENVRRVFGSIGLYLHPFPGTGPGEYLGSPATTPLYVHVAELLSTQLREAPDKHRQITTGIGLDGIEVPRPETMRLPSLVGSGAGTQRRLVDVTAVESGLEAYRIVDVDAEATTEADADADTELDVGAELDAGGSGPDGGSAR